MSSVTNRIKEIKQPKGGYINPNNLQQIVLKDERSLNEEENIQSGIVGMTVDYLSRFQTDGDKYDAFKISLMGAKLVEESENANELLSRIKGLDEESIISACKLTGYDVCFRAGKSYFKPVESIEPNKETIENIRIMVERTVKFLKEYGPVVDKEMTFVGGYTQKVSSGDADFMTEDTLWDLKVSINKPKSAHTLQLLIYYLLGIHSNKEKYEKIKKLAIYNPRMNKIFSIDLKNISRETIENVSDEVIGFNENINEIENIYTVTDLTHVLGCSRYRVMQLYSEGLPLRKEKNKYVISKKELRIWIEQREIEEEERRKREFKCLVVASIVMLVIFIMLLLIIF